MVSVDVLLATIDGHGHFRPMMALGEILHRHSNGVIRPYLMVSLAAGNVLPTDEFPNVNVLPVNLPKELVAGRQNHKQFEWLHERRQALTECGLQQAAKLNLHALVHDPFATWAREVAETLQIPHYVFFPSPLYCFYLMWRGFEKGDDDTPLDIPGIGHLDSATMPDVPPDPVLLGFFDHARKLIANTCSLIVNDSPAEPGFQALQDYVEKSVLVSTPNQPKTGVHALGYLTDYLQPPPTPPDVPGDSVMRWLDKQKPKSTIYIALGSWADLSLHDNVELAEALAATGQPFLWALRERGFYFRNRNEQELKEAAEADALRPPLCETDAHGLPVDFSDRLGDKCFIAPWVNQRAVLAHPAIKLFVTHCGWNSMSEGMSLNPSPLAFLPVAADQHMNAELGEKVWKVGLTLWSQNGQEKRELDRHVLQERLSMCMQDEAINRNAETFYRSHRKHIESTAERTVHRLVTTILSS